MSLKRYFMMQIWRLQQAQMIISMLFWSLTLTGVFYPYVGWRLRLMGIENTTVAIVVLFLFVAGGILAFGYIYDRIFKMWHHQQIVIQERNPYSRGKLTPKEVLYWTLYYIPSLEAEAVLLRDSDEKRAVETMEKADTLKRWVRKNLDEDGETRAVVEGILRDIMPQGKGIEELLG